jgi:hypothetical protein
MEYILILAFAFIAGFLVIFIPSLISFLLFRKQILDRRKLEYEAWKKRRDAEMAEMERMLDIMSRQLKNRKKRV